MILGTHLLRVYVYPLFVDADDELLRTIVRSNIVDVAVWRRRGETNLLRGTARWSLGLRNWKLDLDFGDVGSEIFIAETLRQGKKNFSKSNHI